MKGNNVRRTAKLTLSATFLALAAGLTTACSSEPDTQVYCADNEGYVLPETECEDDDDTGYIYVGTYVADHNRRYGIGERLPQSSTTQTIKANSTSGRTSVGLPARGGFGGNGVTISGSSGG